MTLPKRTKYNGSTRGLVLAFDIGTTFSGISYSILDPGRVPEIRPITRYPCQERVGGDMKVPTVVYYDKLGNPCAIGTETLREGIEMEAEEKGWTKSHWFKLHLRPKSTTWRLRDEHPLPPLPPNKSIEQIFADFMKYLYRCSETFITQTHGEVTWESVQKNINYILTHPNGWGGPQQADMRHAAILASLIGESKEDQSRITFVTEGEASLHFCLLNGLTIDGADGTAGVTIVDAGGGTIDVTSYRKVSSKSFEEIANPKCEYQGAVYVTRRALFHFNYTLAGTKYHQDVPTIIDVFDKSTKHVFRKVDEPLQIRFTSPSENDASLNIQSGRIIVDGRKLAQFFEPSVSSIIEAIKAQSNNLKPHCPLKSAFLVGGFSASDWLYDQVREAIEPLGINVLRPDTHRNKAVSSGAVSFYLDGFVSSRVARSTYGIDTWVPYNPTNLAHFQRERLVEVDPIDGEDILKGFFWRILPQGTNVTKTMELRHSFTLNSLHEQNLRQTTQSIIYYCGSSTDCPDWIDEEPVCRVEANTSAMTPRIKYSEKLKRLYYEIKFDVILLFGLTELQAQIAYTDSSGKEERGPAQVVYEKD